MDNQDKHLPEDEMAGRYLSGESGPEEAMRVDEWRRESKENEKFLNDNAKLWNAAGSDRYRKPDIGAEWEEMQRKVRKRTPVFKLVRVAAAVLLLFGAVIFFKQYYTATNSNRPVWVNVASDFNFIRNVTLPDSSKVVLNKRADLRASTNFLINDRSVLFKGEGFFDITHNASQPFVIVAAPVIIKVIGTRFNVHATDSTVQVSVIEGAVMMSRFRDSIIIRKDQGGVYDRKSRTLRLLNNIDINQLGYATHNFRFNDQPMQEIKKILEKAYPISINFSNPSIGNCRIKTEFDNESVDHMLEVLAKTIGVALKREGDTVNFIGNGCD